MARAALLVTVLLLVLAGCVGALNDLSELRKDIEAGGYEVTGLQHNTTNGHSVLSIQAVMSGEIPTGDDADAIAVTAWEQYSGDIDEVQVAVNGELMLTATASELTERFGERPARSQDGPERRDDKTALFVVLAITGVVVIVGLMVLLWLRGRRPPPPMAPPTYQYPPPHQYPAPPQPPQYPS